ncbi:FAD-dependent oxidoreductase [Actinoplanes sp. NPDC051851]|uniref:FAD-dependent oxidoreductase n=1 Tax=Actinoplanes sp. NPDC051851 TaxID=3154753 RepID=UPI003449EA96
MTVLLAGGGATAAALWSRRGPELVDADLVVYGATAAGLVAAIQARRMGHTAVVVEPGQHVGGMTTGGLGATDGGTVESIGGIAAEFYRRVHAKNTAVPQFRFAPSVASAVLAEMVKEAGVDVYLGVRLHAVAKVGNRITELVGENGHVFRGRMFVDAGYEGDLMDRAGVKWVVGREGNAAYGETINGVQLRSGHQFDRGVDPYVVAGRASSGLLPGISAGPVAARGSADGLIQAYNFRMCLTQDASRIPFTQPDGYQAADYELLFRHVQVGYRGPFFNTESVGGGKVDANNEGPFSTDYVGGNYAYPTASHAERESIVAAHVAYQKGLMWFLGNDPRLPAEIREATGSWGLAADEFTGNGGWSPQIYVREARRMLSAYVMTEHDCRGDVTANDPVGLASYQMDSHNCQRVVVDGVVHNEGDVQASVPGAFPVSFRSIVPIETQCENLTVPVCLAASHIAYGSIRMEPVFMMLAQSAATAAMLALAANVPVQRLDYATLRAKLLADGQVLHWPPIEDGEVVVDNAMTKGVTRKGEWTHASGAPGYFGADFEHDSDANKGTASFRFTPDLPAAGRYTVKLRWTAHENRAAAVPVDVIHSAGTVTRTVDQRTSGGEWVPLGTWTFRKGTAGSVLIRTTGTTGYVVADAVLFTPA